MKIVFSHHILVCVFNEKDAPLLGLRPLVSPINLRSEKLICPKSTQKRNVASVCKHTLRFVNQSVSAFRVLPHNFFL